VAKWSRLSARWVRSFFAGLHDTDRVLILCRCSQADAVLNSGLLLMAVMGLLSPAMLHYTNTEVNFSKSALGLSRFSSCVMLVAYASFIYFELSNNRRCDEATVVSMLT
jgi:hypothetical protein